jgi:microcystin-dependent protein
VGVIVTWPSTVVFPDNWHKCDGTVFAQAAYPELYAVIGGNFDTGGEGAGNFRIPTLAPSAGYVFLLKMQP